MGIGRVKRMARLAMGIGAAVACSSGMNAAAGPASAAWSSTHTVEVTDPQYQMTAFSLAVPAGWKFAGAVARDGGCHSTGAALKTTSASPDGSVVVANMPGFRWMWTTNVWMRETLVNAKCPAVDVDSAAKFLVNIAVPNLRPNAVVVAVTPLPAEGRAAVAAQLEQARQSSAAASARYHVPTPKLIIDGARVRIRYLDRGKPVEEMVQTIIDCRESTTPAIAMLPAATQRYCTARNLTLVHAPAGQLDALLDSPALASLGKSVQLNPDWIQRVSQDAQRELQQAMKDNDDQFRKNQQLFAGRNEAMRERGRQFQAQEKSQFDKAQAADKQRQAAIDDAAHRESLFVRDRQDFVDPGTGRTIEASSYYNHQWLSSDGSTLIQTDNTFDPNGVVDPVSQSWTELVPR